jgi:hypothetical protein
MAIRPVAMADRVNGVDDQVVVVVGGVSDMVVSAGGTSVGLTGCSGAAVPETPVDGCGVAWPIP